MVILLVGLIVLGPDRLPVVARKAGQVLGDLRRVSSGFEAEVRTALYEAEHPERYRPSAPTGSAVDSVVDRPPAEVPVEDTVEPDPTDTVDLARPDEDVPGDAEPRDPAS